MSPVFSAGEVNIYHHGVRGSVCADHFRAADAKVVCRTLGFPDGVAATIGVSNALRAPKYASLSCTGSGASTAVFYLLSSSLPRHGGLRRCSVHRFSDCRALHAVCSPSSETDVLQCPVPAWNDDTVCASGAVAAVQCGATTAVRLVDGDSPLNGRLELLYDGEIVQRSHCLCAV